MNIWKHYDLGVEIQHKEPLLTIKPTTNYLYCLISDYISSIVFVTIPFFLFAIFFFVFLGIFIGADVEFSTALLYTAVLQIIIIPFVFIFAYFHKKQNEKNEYKFYDNLVEYKNNRNIDIELLYSRIIYTRVSKSLLSRLFGLIVIKIYIKPKFISLNIIDIFNFMLRNTISVPCTPEYEQQYKVIKEAIKNQKQLLR